MVLAPLCLPGAGLQTTCQSCPIEKLLRCLCPSERLLNARPSTTRHTDWQPPVVGGVPSVHQAENQSQHLRLGIFPKDFVRTSFSPKVYQNSFANAASDFDGVDSVFCVGRTGMWGLSPVKSTQPPFAVTPTCIGAGGHIRIGHIRYIGRESKFLEDVGSGMLHSEEDAYTEYPDPRRDEWQKQIIPALNKVPISQLAKLSGLSRRMIINARTGKTRPHLRNQELLAAVVQN